MNIDRNSTIADVYADPLGRDIIEKLLLQTGISAFWIRNPLVFRLRLKYFGWFFGKDFVDSLVELMNNSPDAPPVLDGPTPVTWWKRAVFYQVYPRSFADSNDDGIGDLPGILEKLPYLEDLGIDCVWLSPIFASPNKDMGYDISDYRSIMTEMGTVDDLRRLIAACHERGMRIILDLVANHTSDEHPWFQDALANPEGEHGDYYFLRDGDAETLPNNWTSFFSGPAWRRIGDKWVLHLFTPEQLDLNWQNPAVRREVADIVKFWLAEGIDGFRLDVINYISKREGLPNGNAIVGKLLGFTGIEHYFHGPHLHEYLAELRREGFTRSGVEPGQEAVGADASPVMIGETPGAGVEVGRLLTSPQRGEMDLIFSFDHLETSGHVRWDRSENWGFTKGTPWIKAYDDSVGYSVAAQEHNPDSVLRYYRDLIQLRHSHPALSMGSIRFIDQKVKNYFAWFREQDGERWFIEVNLSGRPLRRRNRELPLTIVAGTTKERSAVMEPYEALVCKMS